MIKIIILICSVLFTQACGLVEVEKPEPRTNYNTYTVTLYVEGEEAQVWVLSERPRGNPDYGIYFNDADGVYTRVYGNIVIKHEYDPGIM